jgi:hypothetical protein
MSWASERVVKPPLFDYCEEEREFLVICPITGACRRYAPDLYFETLCRMASVGRQHRFDAEQSARIIPFRKKAVG